MDLQLGGRVAAITGGSEGIGYSSALRFSKEGAGVAICARGADRLRAAATRIEEETKQRVFPVVADVSTADGCEHFIDAAATEFGALDVLVVNAGTAAAAEFEQVSDDAWRSDLDLKLLHAVRCSRAALPLLRKNGGSVVLVLSVLGKAPIAASLPTTVSRAAGLALTKAMSKDLGKYNVRVNAVCVGVIRTAQVARYWPEDSPTPTAPIMAAQLRDVPLGRAGTAEEVANAIVFLGSSAASYITGAALNVDGGSGDVV